MKTHGLILNDLPYFDGEEFKSRILSHLDINDGSLFNDIKKISGLYVPTWNPELKDENVREQLLSGFENRIIENSQKFHMKDYYDFLKFKNIEKTILKNNCRIEKLKGRHPYRGNLLLFTGGPAGATAIGSGIAYFTGHGLENLPYIGTTMTLLGTILGLKFGHKENKENQKKLSLYQKENEHLFEMFDTIVDFERELEKIPIVLEYSSRANEYIKYVTSKIHTSDEDIAIVKPNITHIHDMLRNEYPYNSH